MLQGTREITAPEKIHASHTLTPVEGKGRYLYKGWQQGILEVLCLREVLFSDAAAGTEIKAKVRPLFPQRISHKNGVCTVCEERLEVITGFKLSKVLAVQPIIWNDYSFTINADYKTVRETLEVNVDGRKIDRSSFWTL